MEDQVEGCDLMGVCVGSTWDWKSVAVMLVQRRTSVEMAIGDKKTKSGNFQAFSGGAAWKKDKARAWTGSK